MKDLEPRVFVVDDDQSVRTSLVTLLSAEDYAVESFASAAEYLGSGSPPRSNVPRARRAVAGSRRHCPPTATHAEKSNGADCLHHRAWRYPHGDRGNETRGGRFFAKTVQRRGLALCRGKCAGALRRESTATQ